EFHSVSNARVRSTLMETTLPAIRSSVTAQSGLPSTAAACWATCAACCAAAGGGVGGGWSGNGCAGPCWAGGACCCEPAWGGSRARLEEAQALRRHSHTNCYMSAAARVATGLPDRVNRFDTTARGAPDRSSAYINCLFIGRAE